MLRRNVNVKCFAEVLKDQEKFRALTIVDGASPRTPESVP